MQEQLQALKQWLGQGSINIFGMPFAGKDTQGGVLADLFGAELLGGGMILRGSVIPDHVQDIMNSGGLIPTEDYLNIVLPYLSHEKFQGKPLLLSSVGRWQGEEHGVMQATQASDHPIKAVILLTVDEATARKRHADNDAQVRGERLDDAAEIFTKRLDEYQSKTLPVIDFYRQHGLLIEVDGMMRPAEVTASIIEKLHTKLPSPLSR